ncbi:MAG: DUF349 domain-containing protein [Lentisphaerae bacterium]|nr:DUF349 domain-containing protein [Lentisphaerota bacterium]
MFFERMILKRKLSSSDAAVRLQAVEALDLELDNALLLQLAGGDSDVRVRLAAISRCGDPEVLGRLQKNEQNPQVLALLTERSDELYGEMALQYCAEERGSDAFDRIVDPKMLVSVALRSNSPNLVLAAGARLAQRQEAWLQLLEQLADDRLAMELYQRKMPDCESALALHLMSAARSHALRNAIAEERAKRRQIAEAYAAEKALVEAAEAAVERVDTSAFEDISAQWRELTVHHEDLKNRFLAARYRLFRAQEELLAQRETFLRENKLAADLTAQLEALESSDNWRAIRQAIENWNRCNLNNSRGAAEYAARFNELAAKLAERSAELQKVCENAVAVGRKVLEAYKEFIQADAVPELEVRQVLLGELENVIKALPEVPSGLLALQGQVFDMERELRRRARLESQQRDLARWEHYTLKLDICAELEKLSAVDEAYLPEAARTFRQLRERWNNIGAVPNEKFDELKERYQKICSELHQRLEAFFARRDAERAAAAASKQQLLEEARALADSEDWNATSAKLKDLQNQWKNTPSAGGTLDRELFKEFHDVCDSFFVRRNAVWEAQKQQYMLVAKRKRDLCNAAEALKSLPFNQAKNEIAALREAWRQLPSAGRDERLLYMEFNRIIESIFAAHREAGDEARRQAEINCTNLRDILNDARSNTLPLREIENHLLENQTRWDELDYRQNSDVAKCREALLTELRQVICELHHKDSMHRLEEAEQLESVIDSQLDNDKLIDHLGRRLKVCAELEERLRQCSIISGDVDLAKELTAAISGNFGGDAYRLTVAELDEFLRRFVAVGQVPPDARKAVFERFRTLYNQALAVLNQEAPTQQ